MADGKKVREGITFCLSRFHCGEDCPYYNTGKTGCMELLQKDILEMLKEQESEWLEDSDPGQEYGTTWACRKCMHTIHKPFIWNPYDSGYKYCPHCGAEMKVKLDG